jgi:hypothetical protein
MLYPNRLTTEPWMPFFRNLTRSDHAWMSLGRGLIVKFWAGTGPDQDYH